MKIDLSEILGQLFIVGVQKAGTTSLHDYLAQSSNISAARPKEPYYYIKVADEITRITEKGTVSLQDLEFASFESYFSCFSHPENCWLLDSSVGYFNYFSALQQIKNTAKNPRIIVCLRNPVRRAYSAYNWARKNGWETAETFEQALELEPWRIEKGYWFSYQYQAVSFYAENLGRWLDEFPNLRVVIFEELASNPLEVVNDLLDWLGLEPLPKLHADRSNPSGIDQGRIANFLRRVAEEDNANRTIVGRSIKRVVGGPKARKLKGLVVKQLDRRVALPPRLSDATSAKLAGLYTNDIERVEKLLGKSLDVWRR